ncbi:MAG: glycosyltransferase [Gammaproteobacteria bacterium]|nr:glycosyltransferase [Gammaproteobacteria bacterium]
MSAPKPDPSSGGRAPRLLCLVSLPPPVTGRTIATSRFLERLGRSASLSVVDLSGGAAVSNRGRSGKALKSLGWILRLAFGASRCFDHVYVVANHGSGLWFDIAFAAMARLWGTPVVVHHHVFSYFNRRRRRVALLFRLTGRGCRHLLLCDRMRSACAALYPTSARLEVLPNFGAGKTPVGGSPAGPDGDSPIELVFLSNLTREKGIEDILALARRFAGNERVVFRVAGPAMDEAVADSLRRCSSECPDTFEWLGPVDAEKRSELLASADLFLFPTRYANEAQPLVLIESLEAGVPVLANARGCIGEMIGEGSGLLVAEDEQFVETAARVIERMLSDDAYRAEVRDLAPQLAAGMAGRAERALERFAAQL